MKNMKRLLTSSALFLVFGTMTDGASAADLKEYTCESYGVSYTIKYPANWHEYNLPQSGGVHLDPDEPEKVIRSAFSRWIEVATRSTRTINFGLDSYKEVIELPKKVVAGIEMNARQLINNRDMHLIEYYAELAPNKWAQVYIQQVDEKTDSELDAILASLVITVKE